MEEKKIGILSIISIVASVLGLLMSFMVSFGFPSIIPLLFIIAGIVLGIVALVRKEKIVMPIIGMAVAVLASVALVIVCITSAVFRGVEYVANTVDDYDFNSLYNYVNNYDYNSLYNYTNSYNYNSLYNTSNTTNTTNSIISNTTNITPTNTTSSDTQKVGTVSDGYVEVPKNWARFYDPDSPGVFQYAYANVYIVTLKGIGSSVRSIDEMADIMKDHVAAEGTTNIEVSDATIGGYAAKRVRAYYPADNTWLDMYYVSVNNKLYYISIEGPDKDSDNFKIPSTFTLY